MLFPLGRPQWLDRVPMIALSGQIETQREASFTHQVVDHGRLFAPVSKWTASCARPCEQRWRNVQARST